MKHVLFVGGGTAGHVSPLLAVMEELQRQAPDCRCSYVGLRSDLESVLLRQSPLRFEAYAITSGKLNRFLTWKHLGQGGRLLKGLWQAERLVARLRPDVVFAKGGFVTVPVVLAAARRGIPIACHESDVVMGLANRIVTRRARLVFTTYPVRYYAGLGKKGLHTGQPVRAAFYQAEGAQATVQGRQLLPELPVVTVIGSSIGSRRVNQLVEGAWPRLLERIQLVHITGAPDYPGLEQRAAGLERRERLHLVPFLAEELPALFRRSDLVVSRAGGTVAELAACRLPTILIPNSTAAQNHQWANARVLEEAGAALVLDELTTAPEELASLVESLLDDPSRRRTLAEAIAAFDHPQAAAQMAEALLKLAGSAEKE